MNPNKEGPTIDEMMRYWSKGCRKWPIILARATVSSSRWFRGTLTHTSATSTSRTSSMPRGSVRMVDIRTICTLTGTYISLHGKNA